jgi:hypothetical protein
MARDLTAAHVAQYESDSLRALVFVKLDFSSGIVRTHNGVGTYTWGGSSWDGVGELGGISIVEEGVEIRPLRVKLTLSGIDASLVSSAMTEEYHGRPADIYAGALDSDYQLVADPDVIWSGYMDHMAVSLDKGTGIIELVCENKFARWDLQRTIYYSDAEQQARFPGDLGLEYQAQLQDKNDQWGGGPVGTPKRTPPGGGDDLRLRIRG